MGSGEKRADSASLSVLVLGSPNDVRLQCGLDSNLQSSVSSGEVLQVFFGCLYYHANPCWEQRPCIPWAGQQAEDCSWLPQSCFETQLCGSYSSMETGVSYGLPIPRSGCLTTTHSLHDATVQKYSVSLFPEKQ